MSPVAVVTGASTGLGFATVDGLLRLGRRVIGVSRDPQRSAQAYQRLRPVADGAGGDIEMVRADLSRLVEVRALATDLSARERIDVLVHSAGGLFGRRRETDEGHEMTFALNHLSPFLLSYLLRERLLAAPAGARVVSLNSRFHTRGRVDFDDLEGARRYGALRAYAQAKLANLLVTDELARRWPGAVVNSVYPGDVYTNAARNTGPLIRAIYRTIGPVLFIRPDKGADTIIWAASAPEAAQHTGQYLHRRAPIAASPARHDHALVERLWAVTSALTGVAPD